MKLSNVLACAATLAGLATPALALGASPCDAFDATNDIFQCLVKEHAQADAVLNATYQARQAVLKSYSPARSQALTAAQRAWITLRDLDCASEGKLFDGGTFEKVIVQGCLLRKTEERTAYLEAQYELQAP